MELAILVVPAVVVVPNHHGQAFLAVVALRRRTFKDSMVGLLSSQAQSLVLVVVLARRLALLGFPTKVAMGVCLSLLVHKRITAVVVTAQTLCPTHPTQVSIFATQHQDEAVVARLAVLTRLSTLACLVTQTQVVVAVGVVVSHRRQSLGMAGPAGRALSLSVGKRFRRSHGAFRIA